MMKPLSRLILVVAVLSCIFSFAYLVSKHGALCSACWVILSLCCVSAIIICFGRARKDASGTSPANQLPSEHPLTQATLDIKELRDVDGLMRWELLYEDVHLVLLSERAPLPWRSELLAFDISTLRLIWRLTPQGGAEKDAIVGVWIRDGKLWASSWYGYTYQLDRKTGNVLHCAFTK